MIPQNIDPMHERLFREEEPVHDFRKIAAAKATPPSPEARAILTHHEPDFSDFGEMMTAQRLGLPMPGWVKVSSMSKSATSTSLAKRYIEERGVQSSEARHALTHAHYFNKHRGEEGVTLTERLQGLVDKAVGLLCAEDAELLTKAATALDMHLIAYFLEKAFCGIAA